MLGDGIDYGAVTGLSNEARQRLQTARPRTVGQAGRLDGLTPAALTIARRLSASGNAEDSGCFRAMIRSVRCT